MISSVDPSKIKKILVISLSNIGDVILTTPVISLLRERFPSSSLSVMVGPKGIPLFVHCRTVNELIVFDKSVSWLKKLSLVLSLFQQRYDLVVDLRNTAIPILIFPRYRTSCFVNRSSRSMRGRHLDRLRSLMAVDSAENRFDFFTPEEKANAFQKLEKHVTGTGFTNQKFPLTLTLSSFPPEDGSAIFVAEGRGEGEGVKRDGFIVIAPGAGSELKRWTLSGFQELIRHFLERGTGIVLVGDEREVRLGRELGQKTSKPLANLIGLLTLRELAGLIDEARLVVANDSAVMHLAHELKRPVVSIFGPTDERKYGQNGPDRRTARLHLDCTPCEQAQCRLERRICLDDLPASSVIQASEALLDANR